VHTGAGNLHLKFVKLASPVPMPGIVVEHVDQAAICQRLVKGVVEAVRIVIENPAGGGSNYGKYVTANCFALSL
jgi:hypothetical protein